MKISRTLVESAVENANLEPDSVDDKYSGRHMYGEECLALVGGLPDLLKFFVCLEHECILEDEFEDLPGQLADVIRDDNMGLSMVYYFPGFTLTER